MEGERRWREMELPNREFLCCKSEYQEEEEHLKATALAVTMPNMCFLFENNMLTTLLRPHSQIVDPTLAAT